jgi:glyoxylase-like metal-dependent hydrolase (beta-lactamase superfamily II)
MAGHVTVPAAALASELPSWATLIRAPNPGPMTLDGTNTWVLRAATSDSCVVVDPGPLDEGHLRAVAERGPVEAILLTHGHLDHTEGVGRLTELTGAAPRTLDGPVRLAGVEITPVAAPGHTADSVCFVIGGAEPAVLTGDTILGRGTTVVAWPDGNLGDYLASLSKLAGVGSVPVLPGHGPPLADCSAAVRFYLAHRRARLDQVRGVRATGARTAAEIVEVAYADVDPVLWPAAELSVRAQLDYLDQREGRLGERESRPPGSGLDRP